jgi:hypothetical protein
MGTLSAGGTPGFTTGALDKLFPDGVEFDLAGLGTLQRTANAKPPVPPTPAGGKSQ